MAARAPQGSGNNKGGTTATLPQAVRVKLGTPLPATVVLPAKEFTIKHIVATEMRVAPGDTKATRHALIQWADEKFCDDLTWEPMPGAVARWKPYWVDGWQDAEYKLVRVWAGRKTAKGALQYLVEWEDYPLVDHLTWEPAQTVTSSFPEGLQEYKETGGMVVE